MPRNMTGRRDFGRKQIRDSKGRFGGSWGVQWIGLRNIDKNLYKWQDEFHSNMESALREYCAKTLERMKSEAPWNDRTTNARQSLQCELVVDGADHYSIFVGHGFDIYYGYYLEVGFGGRFAIVRPTVERMQHEIGGVIVNMQQPRV